MDKLTLAGLEATLIEYTRPEGPTTSIPTLNMITRSVERLESDAVALLEELREAMGKDAEIGVEPGIARVGGGALPMSDLPGPRVSVKIRNMSAAALERRLRLGEPPLIVLVKDDRVLLDPRTLLPGQIGKVTQLIKVASLPE
jgi:L-seryl-tRNA(Ser) seleniumtransferase